jgi:chemotaxis family two-component system sensor kinase Cph1
MHSASKQSAELLSDLSECAREPIQFAGAIEPHGLLLVLGPPELEIVQVSVNTGAHLAIEPEALLGRHLGDVLAADDAARLTSGTFKEGKRRYVSGVSSLVSPQGLVSPKRFDALAHKHENLLIIELEPQSDYAEADAGFNVYASLTDAMSEFDGPTGLSDLCERIATRIRYITGFDRVMIYRFLEDDSGSVIAEDRRADLTPFLGLRYPASDMPAQARRLYLLNTLRLKPDVNAQRAAIIPPLNPCTGAALDMSFCILRAMSPVHDEYLRNMGVSSTMSISIMVEGQLWGLVACHHTQAKLVPHPVRVTCEVMARIFSSSIAAAEEKDKHFRATAVLELAQSISVRLRSERDVTGTLREQSEYIKSAMRADGVAFYGNGKLTLDGITPSSDQVNLLLEWLTAHQQVHILATERLASDYPAAATFTNDASGILSMRIALGGPDFIIWFRSAIVKTIHWAGNPEKPVEAPTPGGRINPRRSFELWKQTVGDSTEPWDETDKQFARSMRHVVAEALLLQMNEEMARLNVELSRSNIELDSFAYAASHDLQEPLRTIRAYTQLIIRNASQDFSPKTRDFLSIIESNAGRMGNLITNLLSYSELGGRDKAERKPVNMEEALRWALTNLHEPMQQSGASVTHDALPVINSDPDHMLQLLQNLISNAIKYQRVNEPPRIHLSAVLQGKDWHVSVRDNGQGFAPQYAELIFEAFKRLHGQDVAGSGIGLATCKRIVELNGGRIWAESGGKDQGATFTFTCPCLPLEQKSTER